MKKKVLSIALCAGLMATLLAGCGAGNKAEKTEEAKAEKSDARQITLMIPDWGAPNDQLLAEFKEETGIEVVVNEVGWDDIRDKVSIAAAGGTAVADVVEVDWSWVGEFYAADWLEPIEVDADMKADMPTLETFSIDGKVLAVPYANDYRLSYYNTKQHEAAGITAEPKTWDEVYQNAVKIKEAGITEYPVGLPLNAEESAATSLTWLAYTMNGVVFNDDGTLNKDSVLSALQYEKQLLDADLVAPADKTSSGMDAYRRVLSGDASFITGPTSFVARSNDAEECSVVGEIQPILVPGKTDKAEKTMPLPEAIGITKFSENKEDAATFVKWYSSAETQKKLFETNNTIPTRNSVLEELINSGIIKNSGAMLEEAKKIASPYPNGIPAYYAEMSNAIYNAVNKMALGEMTPEEAFAEMDAKVTELIGK